MEGSKKESSMKSGCKKKGDDLKGRSNVNKDLNLIAEGEIQKGSQREDLNDKEHFDSMWIDGSAIENKVREREGKVIGPANKKQDQTTSTGMRASKYTGNRGWKRLIREVSKRVTLSKKNEVMEINNDRGKRKLNENADKENEWGRGNPEKEQDRRK